jgi:zinc transport system permease protein
MEILQAAFFQRAIIILITASIVSGIIGSLIVIKKISMTSGSIAHGAFGGLGIAYYFGQNPTIGALVFSLIGAVLISLTSKIYKRFTESILSIFWAGGMAIGLIFVFLTPGYTNDLFSYLFGNVLLNNSSDIILLLPLTIIIITIYLLLKESLIVTLFNEDFAKLKGIRVDIIFTIFLLMVALTVVMLIKTMGIVLTLAILTISPTISLKFSKKVSHVIIFSILLNIFTSLIGLVLAYAVDLPTAPVIILTQILTFIISLLFKFT